MSQLEQLAWRELGPLIKGRPGTIAAEDAAGLALWAQKTAHVAMLVSSESDRATGYGLPPSSFRETYELRDQSRPFPNSAFWIGRYEPEARGAAAWVTPIVIDVDGLPTPELPNGYAITVGIGQVLIQGAWLVTPGMDIEFINNRAMPRLWPVSESVIFPDEVQLTEDDFLAFVVGSALSTTSPKVLVSKWRHATDLPPGEVRGELVVLPTLCGEHVICYPVELGLAAMAGDTFVFGSVCECETGYLVYLEPDSAHFRRAGDPVEIEAIYEDLDGEEYVIELEGIPFTFKHLE